MLTDPDLESETVYTAVMLSGNLLMTSRKPIVIGIAASDDAPNSNAVKRQQSSMVAECAGTTILSEARRWAYRGARPAAAPTNTTGITCFSIATSRSRWLWILISVA